MSASVAGTAPHEPSNSLSGHDMALLECERGLWGPGPRKQQVVWERFGLPLPAYYQRLYQVCQTEAALDYDAALVRHIMDTADQVSQRRVTAVTRREGNRG